MNEKDYAEIALKARLAALSESAMVTLKRVLLDANAAAGCPDEIARVEWAKREVREYLLDKEAILKDFEKRFPS